MAIIGLGMDIIKIKRIAVVMTYLGNRLARRILSFYEWEQYQQHYNKVIFLAKRFTAKEAALKALGTGLRKGISFNQCELYHNELGKPKFRFLMQAAKRAQVLGIKNIHVTVTDERCYACAMVILEN